jgi:hypothetical protein
MYTTQRFLHATCVKCRWGATFVVLLAILSAGRAEETVVWDMAALGRLDKTNKAYTIVEGRVSVDLVSGKELCPTGLGHLASGMNPVREIAIRHEVGAAGEYTLQVVWDPGGSGTEQFEVLSKGQSAGKSALVNGEKQPGKQQESRFGLHLVKGANDLVIRYLSGDGLNIGSIRLKAGPPEAQRPIAAATPADGQAAHVDTREAAPSPAVQDSPAADEDPSAEPGKVIWDMNDLGRFDATNRAYPIDKGHVRVDVASETSRCPSGLGQIGEGREAVEEVAIKYKAAQAGDCWLHIVWNPGGSGVEQYEVSGNGALAVKSRRVNAELAPEQEVRQAFRFAGVKGANEIVLRYLSGDGLHFTRMALTTSAAPLVNQTISSELKWPTLKAFSKECGEQGVLLEDEHVRLFAPKRREHDARIVFPYLVKAYDELYKITGVHTPYKLSVYNFTKGNPNGWGGTGTETGTIEYSEEVLDLVHQPEWQRYGVPHVAGYIEEMAHNFVNASRTKFGWEMIGWNLGARVTEIVAGNPLHRNLLDATRKEQAATFRRYRAAGNTFPADLPYNLCDRIHAYVLWECEKAYGDNYWRNFFAEIRKESGRLNATVPGDEYANNNYRCAITVECFDRLKGTDFKKRLAEAGISATVDISSLHPKDPKWNRKLK